MLLPRTLPISQTILSIPGLNGKIEDHIGDTNENTLIYI